MRRADLLRSSATPPSSLAFFGRFLFFRPALAAARTRKRARAARVLSAHITFNLSD